MPAGRPLLFETPEELWSKVLDYIQNEKKPTLSGLAYFLGVDRQTLYNYKARPEFFDIIKKATDYVEYKYEERLIYENNPTGVIFALKNMGWKDKQEIDQNTSLQAEIKHTIDHSKLSEATLREIAGLDKPTESAD